MGDPSPSSTSSTSSDSNAARQFANWSACALALTFATTLLLQAPRDAEATEELVDGIAAQVGSEIVLTSEVLKMTAAMEKQIIQNGGTGMEINQLRKEGLERMIEWRLVEQIVRKAELYASDEEIDRAIEAIGAENDLDPEQLKANVEAAGISFAEYRSQLKREIERSKVIGMLVSSKVEVNESEVEALYHERYDEQLVGGEQIHMRQLLVLYGNENGRSKAQACDVAESARARVLAGEPFQEVAREDNAIQAARGGDIGWTHSSELAGWMTTIVNQLEAGQLSDVLTVPGGCILIEVVEKRAHEFVTLEMARPQIAQELSGGKEAELYQEWMEDLRKSTFIERHGRFVNTAKAGQGTALP